MTGAISSCSFSAGLYAGLDYPDLVGKDRGEAIEYVQRARSDDRPIL